MSPKEDPEMKAQRMFIGLFVPAALLLATAVGLTLAQGSPPSATASATPLDTSFT